MKKLALFITLCIFSFYANAQTDTTQSEEYAIVRVRVYQQSGEISKPLSIYPNPSVSYNGFPNAKFTTKFNSVAEIMNDMNKYGWKFTNSDVIDYKGDGNDSKGQIINTKEYLQILYFKKTIKK